MALVAAETAKLKKTYHHTFEIKKQGKVLVRHTLLLNPQNLAQTEPARATVTQTLGGVYVIDFGSGVPNVIISGTTGYKLRYNDDGELKDGYQEFKHFRNQIYRKFVETNDPSYQLIWYNWEDEDYWQIQPMNFKLQRAVSEPLLYRYEFTFTGISKATVAGVPFSSFTAAGVDYGDLGKRIQVDVSNASEVLKFFNK